MLNMTDQIKPPVDPKNPKYSEALDYFSGTDRWSILRWIWIRRFELPKEDAITFLGGRENEPFLGFLVHYLLGDQEGMEKMVRAYFTIAKNREAGRSFVIRYLYSQYAQKKPTIPDEDLRPPSSKMLRQEIAEWLELSRTK